MTSAASPAIAIDSSIAEGCILSVKIWIPEEKVAEFWKLFKPAYDKVIAEPECRFFVVSRNDNEPGTIQWVEGWAKGPEWLMSVQVKKEYYEPYLSQTQQWYVKDRFLEITTPQAGFANFKAP